MDMPSMAARALSLRWNPSGTLRICTMTDDMLGSYFHRFFMSTSLSHDHGRPGGLPNRTLGVLPDEPIKDPVQIRNPNAQLVERFTWQTERHLRSLSSEVDVDLPQQVPSRKAYRMAKLLIAE